VAFKSGLWRAFWVLTGCADWRDLESKRLWFCTLPKVAPTEGDLGRLVKDEVWFRLLFVELSEFSLA